MKYPVIGITAAFDYEKDQLYLREGYYDAIVQSGGIPLIIPPIGDMGKAEKLLLMVDGLMLTGGPDIDAKYFNENNMPCTQDISPIRDQIEIYLAQKALLKDMPILAICRGVQVLNVAAGGNIYQDIYAQNPGKIIFQHSQKAPRWYPTHEVTINLNSKLFEIFKVENISVNSFHHQAIKDVATGFEISASSSDGIIEAIENKSACFALGVQWHAEYLWQKNKEMMGLFKEFIIACCSSQ